MTNILSAKLN